MQGAGLRGKAIPGHGARCSAGETGAGYCRRPEEAIVQGSRGGTSSTLSRPLTLVMSWRERNSRMFGRGFRFPGAAFAGSGFPRRFCRRFRRHDLSFGFCRRDCLRRGRGADS